MVKIGDKLSNDDYAYLVTRFKHNMDVNNTTSFDVAKFNSYDAQIPTDLLNLLIKSVTNTDTPPPDTQVSESYTLSTDYDQHQAVTQSESDSREFLGDVLNDVNPQQTLD